MAIINRDRVSKAFDRLKTGPAPFVEREIHAAVKARKIRANIIRAFA